MKSKILIVEDEPKVAAFIKLGLTEEGYLPEVAIDGLVAWEMVNYNSYDLVILDINIPYINGFELCSKIREKKTEMPILMLTALGTTENKLQGFESGSDDYLVKPFDFKELVARVRALLKRSKLASSNDCLLKIADLEMNLDTKIVRRNNVKIDLTAKEFMLLEFFIKNKGRVVSRATIAEKVWDITFDTGTNVIDVYVNFLRKKIDKDFDPKLIHTQVGMGYIFTDRIEQ
jgi:two-component system, OmpR family, copper resistance phosphate regulon response regulator CusR